jgi:putative Mg2+ transporter-C (MgtC) family protein
MEVDILLEYLPRLLVAALLASVVGLERDLKGKPSGMRTSILMCVGSALVMILSVGVARNAGPPADPGRIAAQVVTGVGFIGAGMILRSRVSVTGLTSAATIWFIAAVGLVVGYGHYLIGGVATALILVTLTLLDRVEKRFEQLRQLHVVRLTATRSSINRVRAVLEDNRVTPEGITIKPTDEGLRFDIEYIGLEKKHEALVSALLDIDGVDIEHHY